MAVRVMRHQESLQSTPAPLPAASARNLLRHLRDLNLTAERVEIDPGRSVYVEGCMSLDAPVERSLLYRLRSAKHGERALAIRWDAGALQLSLGPAAGGPAEHERTVELYAQDGHWATAPALRARVDLESSEPRQLEHFLRRLVRGVFAA